MLISLLNSVKIQFLNHFEANFLILGIPQPFQIILWRENSKFCWFAGRANFDEITRAKIQIFQKINAYFLAQTCGNSIFKPFWTRYTQTISNHTLVRRFKFCEFVGRASIDGTQPAEMIWCAKCSKSLEAAFSTFLQLIS